MLAAAKTLFLDRGYAGTTIAQVARIAGVSTETVYKSFNNKAGLVKAVFDVSMAGDDEPVPMLQREGAARLRNEPDPRRKLRMYGEHLGVTGPRVGPLQLLIRAAGAVDADAARVWDAMVNERLVGMTALAQHLKDERHLSPDLSVDDARDILWTYNSVELFDLLVLQRGWSPEGYGRWIGEALIAALLP